ncbi:MAG: hypothetical protein DBY39_02550 [Clostridiales bacterium]|nr:MAG: hypothetical protein DBY39_02550 [Clostridiales bacterium]
MKILVIDGQGGRVGRLLIEGLKQQAPQLYITAIGSNSIATASMLKAGADEGATGENPVVFNSATADIIVGPIGIILSNALLGEITPSMAEAVSSSKAKKILIPINRCNNLVVGIQTLSLPEFVELAIQEVLQITRE